MFAKWVADQFASIKGNALWDLIKIWAIAIILALGGTQLLNKSIALIPWAALVIIGLVFLVRLFWPTGTEDRRAKLDIFTTLMMHRKANPPTIDWVNSVNLIDVVFAADENVLRKWHELYAILSNPAQVGTELHQHTYLEMLSEMAKALGFRNLKHTDIDKFYSPQVYAVQAQAQKDLNNLARAFFENINRLMIEQQQTGSAPTAIQPTKQTIDKPR